MRAGPDGVFRLPVPYATGAKGAVHAEAPYQLRCEASEAQVAVPERAVRAGAVVPGPVLSCEGSQEGDDSYTEPS